MTLDVQKGYGGRVFVSTLTGTLAAQKDYGGRVAVWSPVVAAGPGSITGTAAVSIRGPQVSGTGTVAAPAGISGTGAVSIAGPSLAGTGTVAAPPAITGTGAVSIAGPSVSGAGTVTLAAITGTGGVTITGPGAAGAGIVAAPGAITGAGAVSILGPNASGAGTVAPPPAITGTGAVSIQGPVAAGTGTASAPGITGTGQVTIAGPSVSGAGTVAAPATITGTGAVTVRGPQVSGAGTVVAPGAITGTGALSIRGPSAAGAGTVDPPAGAITGSGAVSIRGPSAVGFGGPGGTGPWDLASLYPTGVVRNIGANITAWKDVVFKPDGTRFYLVESNGIDFTNPATAWSIEGGIALEQRTGSNGQFHTLAWKPDGTIYYALLENGILEQNTTFHASGAQFRWSLSVVRQDLVSFSGGTPFGMAFNADGTKLFVGLGSTITQWNLSTAWDVLTRTNSGLTLTLPSGTAGDQPKSFEFKDDGTKLYVAANAPANLRYYSFTLASAYTLAGAALDAYSASMPHLVGFTFKPDGTRLYALGSNANELVEYGFATPPAAGSGAVTIRGPAVAGSGTVATPPSITGTGGVIIAGPSLSGDGNFSEPQWVGATMPFTAKTILENAAVILSDAGGNRWPWTELLGWLSAALREIAIIKPSATADVIEVTLQRGTKQRVPAGYHQMLDATRNLLTSASSPTGRSGGQAITTVTRDEIDAAIPGWHNPAILPYAKAVHHVVDADADPMTFYVVPGNDGTGLIEITASVMPAALPIPANPDLIESYANIAIPMPNAYEEAVLNFVIYRALSKDSMVAGAAARAQSHLALFQQTLGIKQEREDTQNVNRPTHRHSR